MKVPHAFSPDLILANSRGVLRCVLFCVLFPSLPLGKQPLTPHQVTWSVGQQLFKGKQYARPSYFLLLNRPDGSDSTYKFSIILWFTFYRSIENFPLFRSKIEEENIFPVSFKAHKGMNDWRPFIYGGIASVAAESGKIIFQVSFFLYFVLFHL